MVFRSRILRKCFGDALQHHSRKRAKQKLKHIDRYLPSAPASIVDIGAGDGYLTLHLRNKGYSVTPIDVEDLTLADDVEPLLYNNDTLPAEDNTYDVALLLFVLHHTPDPDLLVSEACRVAHTVIVAEDVVSNQMHYYFTTFLDSIRNQEFRHHPRSNRTDAEWRRSFREAGSELQERFTVWRWGVQQTFYLLSAQNEET